MLPMTPFLAVLQALPGWNVLLLAKEPVALNVEDCAQNDIIMAASYTQVGMAAHFLA